MNIDVSPDGQRVAVLVNLNTQEGQRALVLVPTDGGPARELYRGPYSNPLPRTLTWSRDGKFVFIAAVAGESQEILAFPAAGGEPVHTASLMLEIASPSLSPDGHRITFSGSSHEDQIWVIDKMIR
jgi:Tol biopolymer transport system component